MNENNLKSFLEKASQDPVLQGKLNSIPNGSPDEIRAKISDISKETEYPVTEEDLLTLKSEGDDELSEVELSNIAGGINLDDMTRLAANIAKKAVPVLLSIL